MKNEFSLIENDEIKYICRDQNINYIEEFTKLDDVSTSITMECYENEWLYGYILSFGAEAEVIEPLIIRNIITKS